MDSFFPFYSLKLFNASTERRSESSPFCLETTEPLSFLIWAAVYRVDSQSSSQGPWIYGKNASFRKKDGQAGASTSKSNSYSRASLVAQWLRICLPMQGTRVRALDQEDPTCRVATGPVSHTYWACTSGACAPQQERPRWWEACAPRWGVAPARRN